MKFISIILCALVVFCNMSPVKAVLVKSEIDNENQRITVYFSEKKFSSSEIEKVCGKSFKRTEEFDDDDIYRQVSYEEINKIIDDSISYKNKNTSNISFEFSNIATKNQLVLLNSWMSKFNGVISDIYDDRERKIKSLDIDYYYFNQPGALYHGRWGWSPDAEKPKKEFEEFIKKFNSLKNKLKEGQRKRLETRQYHHQEFIKNNYPKANTFKGEYSSSEEEEEI